MYRLVSSSRQSQFVKLEDIPSGTARDVEANARRYYGRSKTSYELMAADSKYEFRGKKLLTLGAKNALELKEGK